MEALKDERYKPALEEVNFLLEKTFLTSELNKVSLWRLSHLRNIEGLEELNLELNVHPPDVVSECIYHFVDFKAWRYYPNAIKKAYYKI